jgi:hypothetical protein
VCGWWICYVPVADGLGNGRLTVGLVDPLQPASAEEASIAVTTQAKAAGAHLDRFGIRSFEEGGHSASVHLDDLCYTAGPGDAGPADRC